MVKVANYKKTTMILFIRKIEKQDNFKTKFLTIVVLLKKLNLPQSMPHFLEEDLYLFR